MNLTTIRLYIVTVGVLFFLLSSCSNEETNVSVFSVDIAADSFVPEGGSKTITLTSNLSWSASTSDDWLTVSPTKGAGGTTITLKALENNTPATRKGIVTLTPEIGESIKISVSQGTRYQFHVDVMELMFPPIRDTLQVSLTSKSSWKVTLSEDWLTVNPKNGQNSSILTFIASPNKTLNERLAVVTLTPDVGDDIEILVTQDGVLFSTDVSEVSFSDSPGEKSITLMSNVSWEAISDVDWLTIDPANGINSEEEQINLKVLRNNTDNDRSAKITLTPEIGESITVSVLQEGNNYVSESIKYVATNAKGSGTGDSEINAAFFLSDSFWKQVNNELKAKSIEVKFLPGDYKEAYIANGLNLIGIGNENNKLTITGSEDVVFRALEGYPTKNHLIYFNGCQNIHFRDFNFTGNGSLNYVLPIRTLDESSPSKNILIENCTWIDMLGVVYGATGCHYKGTKWITYKNCTFKRIGAGVGAHMMYHAYKPSHIKIIDCHFEDCKGDFVRFRDESDYGIVRNSLFIKNSNYANSAVAFINITCYNSKDPGNEYFGTNYSFSDIEFVINAEQENTNSAILLRMRGFSPPDFNYLLTAEEGSLLKNGTKIERANLLKENLGIDVNKIRVANNTFHYRVVRPVSFYSIADYGAESKGFGGSAEITDLMNNSSTPFLWESYW